MQGEEDWSAQGIAFGSEGTDGGRGGGRCCSFQLRDRPNRGLAPECVLHGLPCAAACGQYSGWSEQRTGEWEDWGEEEGAVPNRTAVALPSSGVGSGVVYFLPSRTANGVR